MIKQLSPRVKNVIYGVLIIIGLILLDQVAKIVVAKNMAVGEEVKVIGNFFKIKYVQNSGAAWGMFDGQTLIFKIAGALAVILFGYFMKDFNLKDNLLFSCALALMFAGTVGNLIDRLAYDYVIDFFSFNFGSYSFPVFNLADSYLTLGVIAMIIHFILVEVAKA